MSTLYLFQVLLCVPIVYICIVDSYKFITVQKPRSLAEIKIPIIDNKKQNIIGKLYEDSLNMYRRSIDSKNEMNSLFSEIYGAI